MQIYGAKRLPYTNLAQRHHGRRHHGGRMKNRHHQLQAHLPRQPACCVLLCCMQEISEAENQDKQMQCDAPQAPVAHSCRSSTRARGPDPLARANSGSGHVQRAPPSGHIQRTDPSLWSRHSVSLYYLGPQSASCHEEELGEGSAPQGMTGLTAVRAGWVLMIPVLP